MDYREAEFVRFVRDDEPLGDLVEEAKADTWAKGREHAVLVVRGGRGDQFMMVRGGRDGIVLARTDDGVLVVQAEGRVWEVVKLAWHVHPEPTGPSDQDRRVLEALGQDSSMLYEIRGPAEGTRFYRTGRQGS